MILVGSFGALAMVNEYSNGLIRTTFTAVPDRARVIAAKAMPYRPDAGGRCAHGGLRRSGRVTAAMLVGMHVAFPSARPRRCARSSPTR